jgi:hypothetical protein
VCSSGSSAGRLTWISSRRSARRGANLECDAANLCRQIAAGALGHPGRLCASQPGEELANSTCAARDARETVGHVRCRH